MPELTLHQLDDSHRSLEFEFYSPEEMQEYAPALLTEVPEGYVLACWRGKSKQGRTTLTVGPQKIGEAPPSTEGTAAKLKAPVALEVPEVVKTATDPQLDKMAAKAGLVLPSSWASKSRALREAEVARAMKKQNIGP